MASAQIINCIACKEPVRPRQQGLQCDGCFRWNHRVCNTGISLEVYRAAVREGVEVLSISVRDAFLSQNDQVPFTVTGV